MSNIYDIASRIVNAIDLEEATHILYNDEGISINTSEYYQSIISNFLKKKETIIKKDNNGNLIFDLNNINDLYNIVIISEYIKEKDLLIKEFDRFREESSIQIETYYHQYNKIVSEHRGTGNVDHNDINIRANEKKDELINYIRSIFNDPSIDITGSFTLHNIMRLYNNLLNEKYKNQIETYYEYDWVSLANSNGLDDRTIKKLKQDVNIFHKFRNCFGHNYNGTNIDKNVEINNDAFKLIIPIEYIDGFNKGEIKVNDNDKIIIDRTNYIISPLLSKLNYNISNIRSFFYNTSTENLEMLLNYFENDIDKIYKLPPMAFKNAKSTIMFMQNEIDVSKLNYFSFPVRSSSVARDLEDMAIDKIHAAIKDADTPLDFPNESIKLHKAGIDILNLPLPAFLNPENTIKMYENGVNIKNLSVFGYSKPNEVLLLQKYFKNYNIDITELPNIAFEFPKNAIMLNQYFKNSNKDITEFPDYVFYKPKETIKLFKKGIDIIDTIKNAEDDFKNLFVTSIFRLGQNKKMDITKLSATAIDVPKIALKLKKHGIDVSELNGYALYYYKNVIKLKKHGIDVTKIEDCSFEIPDNIIKLYDYFEGKELDITELSHIAYNYPDEVIQLYENGINIKKLEKNNSSDFIMMDIEEVYNNTQNIIKLHNYFKDKNIDITYFKYYAFEYYNETIALYENGIDISKLKNDIQFKNYKTTIKLYNYFKDKNIDITEFPSAAYEIPEAAIKLYEYFSPKNINIINFADSIYKNYKSVIELYERGIDLTNSDENNNLSKLLLKSKGGENKFIENAITLSENGIDINDNSYSEGIFYNAYATIELLKSGVDIKKLPEYAFEDCYSGEASNKALCLYKYFKDKNFDITTLPSAAFYRIENTIKLYEVGIDITKLKEISFEQPENTIRLYKSGIDVLSLPEKLLTEDNANPENIKYILNVVDNNYERLDEFPIDLYICDTVLLDEMLNKYNVNIAKSIFGTNNPKIIASLIYCNSVLSRYDEDSNISDSIDINTLRIICDGYRNTSKYDNNITNTNINPNNYFEQYYIDSNNGNRREQPQIKAFIIRKIRNACIHFRFKPVYDKEGNMVEDMVYLYDKNNDFSPTNFNTIIKLKDLIEIVNKVETKIEQEEIRLNQQSAVRTI